MLKTPDYAESYKVRPVILFGGIGSLGIIFFYLFSIYLTSDHHPLGYANTIDEMMSYTMFFSFAIISFILASFVVRRFRERLTRLVVSWLPVAILGSVIFSFSFNLATWLIAINSYRDGDPFRIPPPTFLGIVGIALFFSFVLAPVSMVPCAIAMQFPSLIIDRPSKGLELESDSYRADASDPSNTE
ncbi:MAG TPA: hypothetical protein VJV05_06830 [Pyrinomonadaceae bacterium]|nr:hypothetical protein [Pyrinomonadaceae bacterium]